MCTTHPLHVLISFACAQLQSPSCVFYVCFLTLGSGWYRQGYQNNDKSEVIIEKKMGAREQK